LASQVNLDPAHLKSLRTLAGAPPQPAKPGTLHPPDPPSQRGALWCPNLSPSSRPGGYGRHWGKKAAGQFFHETLAIYWCFHSLQQVILTSYPDIHMHPLPQRGERATICSAPTVCQALHLYILLNSHTIPGGVVTYVTSISQMGGGEHKSREVM